MTIFEEYGLIRANISDARDDVRFARKNNGRGSEEHKAALDKLIKTKEARKRFWDRVLGR